MSYLLGHLEGLPITRMRASETAWGDALDLRDYLRNTPVGKTRTIKKIMTALRAVYNEEIYRGSLTHNPFVGILQITFEVKKENDSHL